jgi:hypothetical protein
LHTKLVPPHPPWQRPGFAVISARQVIDYSFAIFLLARSRIYFAYAHCVVQHVLVDQVIYTAITSVGDGFLTSNCLNCSDQICCNFYRGKVATGLSYPLLVPPRDILSNTKRASRPGANHTISEADLRG